MLNTSNVLLQLNAEQMQFNPATLRFLYIKQLLLHFLLKVCNGGWENLIGGHFKILLKNQKFSLKKCH